MTETPEGETMSEVEGLADRQKLTLVGNAIRDRQVPGSGPYLLGLSQMSNDELKDEQLRLTASILARSILPC